jgi:hypothetical protein
VQTTRALENVTMKVAALSLVVLISSVQFGCDRKPAVKVDNKPGIEVNAPGVHVEAGDGKGVEVQAPGVQVQTPPAK